MREKILSIISKNGKLSAEDLAAMLDASPEEIREAIDAMEKEGVICGYPTLINWDNTDCERVTALIEVKITPERGRGFDKVAERIYQFHEGGGAFCGHQAGADGIGHEYRDLFCAEKI